MDIAQHIRTVNDFPKAGVCFYDITPLLADAEAFSATLRQMAEALKPYEPAKIVSAEARGFIFGAPLASMLGIGFVPIRKPGKLPYRQLSESYSLEYSENTLCMHEDALGQGERVAIVDDVLATGGTLDAIVRLVRKCHAEPVACAMLIELDTFAARNRFSALPIISMLHRLSYWKHYQFWSGGRSMPRGWQYAGKLDIKSIPQTYGCAIRS